MKQQAKQPIRRNDPSVKKLLIIIYILYFLGLIESIILPTNGLIMVLGFAILLFQFNTFKESSYASHYMWLIICTIVLLAFSFLNFSTLIHIRKLDFKFQTKYIGQIIYFILTCYGLFSLIKDKPLPTRKRTTLPE